MPTLVVNEDYITQVNNLLARFVPELGELRSGQNVSGQGPNKTPSQILDNILLKNGSDGYALGNQLKQRLGTQLKSLSEQLANRSVYLSQLNSNVNVFLSETDNTENYNTVKAGEFTPYLPK
ncbi:hypothetical protein [Micromonospora sp. NPDC050200]|uniref:hypothetical protein n=1 Tax=Micromonospora sp. NPDC050200 TaxID=3155664 RepID=UPI0033E73DBF